MPLTVGHTVVVVVVVVPAVVVVMVLVVEAVVADVVAFDVHTPATQEAPVPHDVPSGSGPELIHEPLKQAPTSAQLRSVAPV